MLNGRDILRARGGIREQNRRKIIKALMCLPANQQDLKRRCGLSQATISNGLQDLRRRKIIETRSGRNATTRLVEMTGVAVGVSLGITSATLVARRLDGRREQQRALLPVGLEAGRGWLDPALAAIAAMLARLEPDSPQLATVGMAIPVVVDPRAGTPGAPPAVGRARGLPPWWPHGTDPAAQLGARLPEVCGPDPPRVLLDQGATLGALAEQTLRYRRMETLVFVGVSRHVSAGLMVGDRIVRGRYGGAGSVGHLVIRPEGTPCWCGNRGCLEAYLSTELMLAHARRLTRQPFESLRDLIAAAAEGEGTCRRALREGGTMLGAALGSVCNLLNPDVIVLGGELAPAGGLFLEPCRAELEKFAWPPGRGGDVAVTWSDLDDPMAEGALLLGILGHHD